MHKNLRSGSRHLLAGALVMASAGLTVGATEAWAKHRTAPTTSWASDPCAEPTAFVRDRIAKIRALKAQPDNHTSTVASLFASSSGGDADVSAKIAELRHDADGVNDLLDAGGCKAIDIDQEIKGAAAAATRKASF